MSKKKIVTILAFITTLLLFKVYISNSIYFQSRDIQKTRIKIDALKEEQSMLKLKIEKLKYKNEISDPLFSYEQIKTNHDKSEAQKMRPKTDIKEDKKPVRTDELFDALEGY